MKEFKNIRGVAFEINNNKCIYDTFSNQILQVDPVVVDILDDTFVLTRDEIIEKYGNDYSREELDTAFSNIKKIQEEARIFINYEIPAFSISSDYSTLQKVRNKLEGSVTQLIFNVTEDCNLRCKYCVYSGAYEGRRVHNKEEKITWEVGKKAIDLFVERSRDSKDRFISFYGGEPLLNFKFIKKTMLYTQEKAPDMRFSITTNATLLNEEILDFLTQTPTSLVISLDGPQEIHDKYRVFENQKGTHEDVIGKIKLIKEKYPEFYKTSLKINSVLAPHEENLNILDAYLNNDPMLEFLDDADDKFSSGLVSAESNTFCKEYNYDEFFIALMTYCFRILRKYHVESGDLSKIKVPMSVVLKFLKTLHIRSHKRMDEYSFFWPNGICIPGMRSIFVSGDGTLYPCEKLYDYKQMPIGHVNSGYDYPAITGYIDQYSDVAIDICKKCWAYRLCALCFLDFRKDDGFDVKRRKSYCPSQKNILLMAIKLYTAIRQENPEAFKYIEEFPSSVGNFVDQMMSEE